jgi:hypothetical protein
LPQLPFFRYFLGFAPSAMPATLTVLLLAAAAAGAADLALLLLRLLLLTRLCVVRRRQRDAGRARAVDACWHEPATVGALRRV